MNDTKFKVDSRRQVRREARSESIMYGRSLAQVFSAPDYDCRTMGPDRRPEFAVTRLRSESGEEEKAPEYPADDAILICVSLIPARLDQWHAIYSGRRVGVTRAIPFATTFLDLNCRMEMWARGPFEYLHYYLSSALLNRISIDNGIAPSFQLREAFFIEDLVVAEMTKSILLPVTHGEPLDRLALDHVAMMLGAHTLQTRCGVGKFKVAPRRGLEAWQRVRAEEMLRAHLEGNLTVKELANECALSESHFARCFRLTFRTSVHQRLIQIRMEHAKKLLSRTTKPLVEVAILSGFCDQAAFTRAFSRMERMSPSRWRRFNSAAETCEGGPMLSRSSFAQRQAG
jgi:AraC family transcriptional regulator